METNLISIPDFVAKYDVADARVRRRLRNLRLTEEEAFKTAVREEKTYFGKIYMLDEDWWAKELELVPRLIEPTEQERLGTDAQAKDEAPMQARLGETKTIPVREYDFLYERIEKLDQQTEYLKNKLDKREEKFDVLVDKFDKIADKFLEGIRPSNQLAQSREEEPKEDPAETPATEVQQVEEVEVSEEKTGAEPETEPAATEEEKPKEEIKNE